MNPLILQRGLKCLALGAIAFVVCGSVQAADGPSATPAPAPSASPGEPEWKAMDYGPFFSATLEVSSGNIANKGIAIRLDAGDGGVSHGHDFFLFETDTLRAAAGWSGTGFIDWKNIAFDGTHEVHASIVGNLRFSNPDAPGWAGPEQTFDDQRLLGRDGKHYGPVARDWAHWRGLYVAGDVVVLSYTVGQAEVLESPGLEKVDPFTAVTRTFNIGRRSRPLVLQVAQRPAGLWKTSPGRKPAQDTPVFIERESSEQNAVGGASSAASPGLATAFCVVGGPDGLEWLAEGANLRLRIPAGEEPIRFKVFYVDVGLALENRVKDLATASAPPKDLAQFTHGGLPRWTNTVTTKIERIVDARLPYQVESISLPVPNPYHSWMRLGGFDFFKDPRRAAVCTWQGDVWLVDGLGGSMSEFHWKRIASGLFQPLGLKIVDEKIYVTCRDQITVLRDLNGDGETDYFENFNNDAQVTEHFHEFAMDLQTDAEGNFYYGKGGRHARDALVPQHGTLLRVSKDGAKTDIVANGFRAPNGVCVNGDGTFVVSDQEGHWTPENRINWVRPGGFYGYMMGYHEGRQPDDFEPPVVWIHKSLDRSPAEQLWVTSDHWGLPKGSLISLSYGTGKILGVLYERVGNVIQGAVYTLPVTPMPTGIMRGRFHPDDGQLYTAGLFGWAGDKTRPGGFYRVRYGGKPLHVPTALHAARQGMVITFSTPLDAESAADPENYAVSRWTYKRTANYGSDDYKISQKGERGRDAVQVTGVKLSPDKRTVLLEITDMQPCMQMEIKYNLQAADGAKVTQLIENTVLVVGSDWSFNGGQ
jgi:hypothetical protein